MTIVRANSGLKASSPRRRTFLGLVRPRRVPPKPCSQPGAARCGAHVRVVIDDEGNAAGLNSMRTNGRGPLAEAARKAPVPPSSVKP